MAFNPKDYQPVEQRLREFLSDYPDGRIITELAHYTEDNVQNFNKGRFIVKAYVYLNAEDQEKNLVKATGYAEEIVGQGNVNKTSALENCDTSAIGRALANAGYAPKGKRPSQEEMVKVVSREVTPMTQDHIDQLVEAAKLADKNAAAVKDFAEKSDDAMFDKLMKRITEEK